MPELRYNRTHLKYTILQWINAAKIYETISEELFHFSFISKVYRIKDSCVERIFFDNFLYHLSYRTTHFLQVQKRYPLPTRVTFFLHFQLTFILYKCRQKATSDTAYACLRAVEPGKIFLGVPRFVPLKHKFRNNYTNFSNTIQYSRMIFPM